jgi:hypothetical protein
LVRCDYRSGLIYRPTRVFFIITNDAKQQTQLPGWMYLGITTVGYTVNAGTRGGGGLNPHTLVQTRTMTIPKRRPEDAQLSQDLRGFFKPKPTAGRKKKRPRGPAPAPPPYTGPLPAAARKTKPAVVKTKKPKVKMTRTNWALPANQEILQQAIDDWLNKTGECEEHHSMREFAALCGIPKGTFSNYVTGNAANRNVVGKGVGRPALFTAEDVQVVVDTIKRSDRGHDGMSIPQVHRMCEALRPDLEHKQVVNAMTRTVRPAQKKQLTGKVKAQATTTKRSAINIPQQYR